MGQSARLGTAHPYARRHSGPGQAVLTRMLKKAASFVLASFRPSTGTQPPHHSAARTNLVLLIRRTVRPKMVRLRAVTRCGLAGRPL